MRIDNNNADRKRENHRSCSSLHSTPHRRLILTEDKGYSRSNGTEMGRFFERYFRFIRLESWMQVSRVIRPDLASIYLGRKRCNSKKCFRMHLLSREITETHSIDDPFRTIAARLSIVRQPYSPIRRLSPHLPLSFSKWSVGFSFRDCSLGTWECIVRKCFRKRDFSLELPGCLIFWKLVERKNSSTYFCIIL